MSWHNWLESVCGKIHWKDDQGSCHCPLPGHGGQDKHPSFSVNAKNGQFYCHKEGVGGGPRKLAELTGNTLPDEQTRKSALHPKRQQIDKLYDYTDATGKLIYQAVRLQPKGFYVRRPNPECTGAWLNNLTDCEPLPYRLPALLAAIKAGETVFVVEGEKDADALAELGLAATTNHGGAGKWTSACSRYFAAGARVVVIADNDRPGQDHALDVARKLQDLGCDVCNLTLPDLPEKGDVSDWIRSGGNKTELLRLVQMQRAQAEFAFTDLGNAERFAASFADQLRYCADWKKWLYWNENHWRFDNTGETERKAAAVVRQILSLSATLPEESKQKAMASFARRCESAARLGSLLTLAQSQAQLAVTADAFDSDPWLFNTQNCLIDLQANQVLPHDPARLVTKLSPVVYDPAATCPTWDAFLGRVLADRPELIRYLQKAVGYSLTGETGEQCLFLLYGQGANGKSTFLSTIMGILNTYSRQLPMDALLAKTNRQIPNDIAALRGARFASAVEADDGSRMAESLVKQMTGQDKLTARFLHGEWFEFDAQFKLWLATNHKPVIRGCDEAIWRRMRLIPFTVTIPAAERDPHLGEQLRQEWPGILNWALEGCRLWREEGLIPPEDVLAATEEYRGEMDILADFVAQCCVINPLAAALAADTYRAYETWCVKTAERPVGNRTFVRRMRERGLKTKHGSGHVLMWDGLALAEAMPTEPEADFLQAQVMR
jgi:putative DNA primase/helicase